MSSEKVEIEVLFQQLARAHADHNANAIFEAYAPDAVIYDLAPPLGRRGMNRDSVAAWLAGWEGPILIDALDVNLTVEGDLAFMSAFSRMRGRQGGSRPGYVVSHNDVPSKDKRAMANCL